MVSPALNGTEERTGMKNKELHTVKEFETEFCMTLKPIQGTCRKKKISNISLIALSLLEVAPFDWTECSVP